MRVAHYIRPAKSSSVPERFLVLDVAGQFTEDKGHGGKRYESFRTWYGCEFARVRGHMRCRSEHMSSVREEAWQFIFSRLRKRERLWIFGHRLSRLLTLLGAWGMLENGGLTLGEGGGAYGNSSHPKAPRPWRGYVIAGDPPFVLYCRATGKPGSIIFADVLNYFTTPIGYETISTYPSQNDTPEPWASESEIFVSLSTRAKRIGNLMGSLTTCIGDNDLGGLKPTLAGCGYASWLRSCEPKRVLVHDDSRVLKLERDAVFGGRNELRRIGPVPGPVYHLDFSWYYPSIMGEHSFPVRCESYRESAVGDLRLESASVGRQIAEVGIRNSKVALPVRRNGKLLFCTGSFVTVLCGPELEEAYNAGVIDSTYRLSGYVLSPVFQSWFDKMRDLRAKYKREGNQAMEAAIKYIANACYGKFLQKLATWERAEKHDWGQPFGEVTVRNGTPNSYDLIRYVGWRAERKTTHKKARLEKDPATGELVEAWYDVIQESRDSVPSVGAWIASWGRHKLQQAQLACGDENWYYCDTDSLMVSAAGMDRLNGCGTIAESVPGRLRQVAVAQSASFRGLKDYDFDGKSVSAGVGFGSRRDANGVSVTVQPARANRLLSSCPGDSLEYNINRRSPSEVFLHGVVRDDGSVRPFELRE